MVNVDRTLQTAVAYHQAGNTQEAFQLYWDILSQDLHHPDALHLSGLLAYQEGRYVIARDLIEHSLRLMPPNPDGLNNYALVLEKLGDFDGAVLQLQQALMLDPDYFDAWLNLGGVYQAQGERVKALRVFHQLLKVYGPKADILYPMGQLFQEAGKIKQAQRYYSKLLGLNPHHVGALFQLGRLAMDRYAWPEATVFLEKALKLDPTLLWGQTCLAICCLMLGKLQEAQGLLEKPQPNHPDSMTVKTLLLKAKYLQTFQLPALSQPGALAAIAMTSPCGLNDLGGGQHSCQVARMLHQLGYDVLFIQKIVPSLSPEPFPIYQEPFWLQQAPATAFQQAQFKKILTQFTLESQANRLFLVTMWTPYLVGLIPTIREMGYRIAYWCLDDWQQMQGKLMPLDVEQSLAQQADFLFATSHLLAQKLTRLSGKPCTVIPNGFSRANFPVLEKTPPLPPDLRMGKEKTFVYWGNLASEWIDWELLDAVASRHPEWTFNLIGDDLQYAKRAESPNVFYLGIKPVDQLQPYGCHADIGFIHFKDIPLIQAVNPVKAYEYLACGLPIISTPMPELNAFPYTWQIHDVEGFETAVQAIENTTMDPSVIDQFLNASTWQARTEAFLNAVIKEGYQYS